MIKYIYIVLTIWILAAGSIGFSESFPNRPTATEMGEKVRLGIHCVRGVNERCWATQYQTNPAAYYVTSPFTNVTGLYLNQDMMVGVDAKMKELPPYYTDASPGRYLSNVQALTVTGLFYSLQIGNKTNQFTKTPANGTNAATYGDCSWRMYVVGLQERYNFLWSMKNPVRFLSDVPAYTGGTDNATSGERWSVTVIWWNGYHASANRPDMGSYGDVDFFVDGEPYEWLYWCEPGWGCFDNSRWHWGGVLPQSWNQFAKERPTDGEMLSKALLYWGTNGSGTISSNTETHSLGGAFYEGGSPSGVWEVVFHEDYSYYASTSATIGAYKGYGSSYSDLSSNDFSLSQSKELTIVSGTYSNRTHYLGLTPEAESTNLFCSKITVTVTGGGGGNIPLKVRDDTGIVCSKADLSANDSPFIAYTNAFHSLLEIEAGNLNAPDIPGERTYSFNNEVGQMKSIVMNLYFQDPINSDIWHDEFNYCIDEY